MSTKSNSPPARAKSASGGIYIGIVRDPTKPYRFSIAILDFNRRRIVSSTFNIATIEANDSTATLGPVEHAHGICCELEKAIAFIEKEAPDKDRVQLLVESPQSILAMGSPQVRLLVTLTSSGYGHIAIGAVTEDESHVQLKAIPPSLVPDDQPFFTLHVLDGTSRAYAAFLLGTSEFTETDAICAALIAENQSLYHYFIASGEPPSGPDVFNLVKPCSITSADFGMPGLNIKHVQRENVICQEEMYGIAISPLTRFERIEAIPHLYDQASKRHWHLGRLTAYKFGLLQVCRNWRIKLYCKPSEYRVKKPKMVYKAEGTLPAWLCDELAAFAGPDAAIADSEQHTKGAVEGHFQPSIGFHGSVPFAPETWYELCERLGRNPFILQWARVLLSDRGPGEIMALLPESDEETAPDKRRDAASEEKRFEHARRFLRMLAYTEATKAMGSDVTTFVKRARVFETMVPPQAFKGCVAGLDLDLEVHLPALQRLGIFEAGEFDGMLAYLVSRLAEPALDAPDSERWHRVAALFWEQEAEKSLRLDYLQFAWKHALQGRCKDIADRTGQCIDLNLHNEGLHDKNIRLARQHLKAFPAAESGLRWAGYAEFKAGDPERGWQLYEQAIRLVRERGAHGTELGDILRLGANILLALGRTKEAKKYLEEAISLLDQSKERTGALAESFKELAVILHAHGEFENARTHFERALAIYQDDSGTDEHPAVAVTLRELAMLLLHQGDLEGARAHLERALTSMDTRHGISPHLETALCIYELAEVTVVQEELEEANAHIERMLSILESLHGAELHMDFAAPLNLLAIILYKQGDYAASMSVSRRTLTVIEECHGTLDHVLAAEATFNLAQILIEKEGHEEATTLLVHAAHVFGTHAPEHPLLTEIQQFLGALVAHHVASPTQLAGLALALRHGNELDSSDRATLERGLDGFRVAGPPHNSVAAFLSAVADGVELPQIAKDLPEDVVTFLHTVQDATRSNAQDEVQESQPERTTGPLPGKKTSLPVVKIVLTTSTMLAILLYLLFR